MSTTTPLFGYYPLRINATTHRFQFKYRDFDITLTTAASAQGHVKTFTLEANSRYGLYKTLYNVRKGLIVNTKYKTVTCAFVQCIERDLFNDNAYLEFILGQCIDNCAADIQR